MMLLVFGMMGSPLFFEREARRLRSRRILESILPYQQEIKREQSEHLISPDMVTTESLSAKRDDCAADGFWSLFYHIRAGQAKEIKKIANQYMGKMSKKQASFLCIQYKAYKIELK